VILIVRCNVIVRKSLETAVPVQLLDQETRTGSPLPYCKHRYGERKERKEGRERSEE